MSIDHLQDPDDGLIYKPKAVAESCQRCFEACKRAVQRIPREKPVVTLGGDHSVAIGSIAGLFETFLSLDYPLAMNEPVVIWFDAHADINTLRSTASGNIHGCPVAFLVDHPDTHGLTGFSWFYEAQQEYKTKTAGSPFINPRRLGYIGLRDVEDGEKDTMREIGVRNAWFMEDIIEVGRNIELIVKRILGDVDPEGKRPIHLSLDVDGMDPEFTPSTGTPVPGGVTLEETLELIRLLKATGRLLSVDIVEVNPLLGSEKDSETTISSTAALLREIMK